jgi:hypothetical protein
MPPNTVHRIAPLGSNAPMRALAFAASFMPPGGSGTEAERGGIAGVNARRYRHRRRREGAVREWRPAVLLSGRQHEAGMYPDRLSSRQA